MSDNQLIPQADAAQLISRIKDRSLGVSSRLRSVGEFLTLNKGTMLTALPKHITPDRLIRVALNCIRKTPKLLDCTPESLFGAIIEASALGLEPNGVLGHAYLVPYRTECTLIPGYKGLIDLCRRSSTISTLTAECVHAGDKFAYQLGDDPYIRHIPNDEDVKRHEKPVTHVYVVIGLRDGGVQRKVWSRAKVDAHKEQYSQGWRWAEKGDKSKGGGKKDSPWHTNWQAMAKKTLIRDMVNRGEVPVSVEIQNLAMREELYEADRNRAVDQFHGVSLGELDNVLTGSASQVDDDADPADDNDPPPDAAGEIGEDSGDLDGDLLETARQKIEAAASMNDIALIDKAEIEYSDRAQTEGERSSIAGMAQEARDRCAKPKGGKQKAFTA